MEPWLQAGKYVGAMKQRPAEAERLDDRRAGGDRTPDRTQRLLNRAAWDTFAAMGVVRRFAVAGWWPIGGRISGPSVVEPGRYRHF